MPVQFDSTPLNKENLTTLIRKSLNKSALSISDDLLNSVEVLAKVESTNSYLLNQTIPTDSSNVCIAEAQSAGRGRRGNEWLSAPNRNIMLSLSWGFTPIPESIAALSLAVGVTVAERLNRDYELGVSLKWPNDLLIGEDKLAGILVDMATTAGGGCNIVIGLGLNVYQPEWSHSNSPFAWTDLQSHGVNVNRNELAANLIVDCLTMLQQFSDQGFAPLNSRWNALSAYNNKKVILTSQAKTSEQNQDIIGRMNGVDEVGALVVETVEGETEYITSSSYSLRPYISDE